MKLWRKMAKKTVGEDGSIKRNGRQLKRMMQQMDSKNIRVTPNGSISIQPGGDTSLNLLETLFKRAGIEKPKTEQEQAEEALVAAEKATNETV